MSDRTIQAVYQALTDQNLPLTPIDTNCLALGTQLLQLLPPNAYWALVQQHESRGLLALYTLSPNPHDYFPAAASLLEDQRVQIQARHLAAAFEGDGPWWVLLAAQPHPELKPPCRIGAATDLRTLPVDESLARLSQRLGQPPSDRPVDLRRQLEQRLQELGEVVAPHLPMNEQLIRYFYENVFFQASYEMGRNLGLRLVGSAPAPKPGESEDIPKLLEVDAILFELGSGLVSLAQNEAPLLARTTSMRRHLAQELGLELPTVRFRDNLKFKPFEFVLKIRDLPVGRAELREGHLLCIGPEKLLQKLGGDQVLDPTYGFAGRWVLPEQRARLEQEGAVVLCHVTMLAVQLLEASRAHAPELLTLEMAQRRLRAPAQAAALAALEKRGVDEVTIWHLLRELLRERVSVRDLTTILQSLLDDGDQPALAKVRRGLARQLTNDNLSEDGKLYALVVKPDDEQQLLGPAPEATAGRLVQHLRERAQCQKYLTSSEGRMRVSAQLRKFAPECQVLAPEEIVAGTPIVDLA